MSLLSLDSSFQNPSQNRHGSLANITSSIHSSPKSNRNTLKPTSSSKSIEKPPNNRNNSSTKKAPLAKTPQKFPNKAHFSPLPLSKRSIPRNDANPEFKRSYDPSTNRAAPRDPTLKRSSSKPLTNISMCSSRVSSNLTHSDLRQSTFDKLNDSIEALAKSALAESLYHAKEMPPRGSQSSSRKPQSTKSREPEVSSFSASGSKNQTLSMSGSKRNIMNSQNTSFVMQKVYSVNNKALNLTNLLTRPRSREDLSSRHPVLTSASRKDIKENDPKFTPVRQSLDHSTSTSSKLNMQKRLSEPAVKSKGLEVRNLNTSNICNQSQETPYIPSSLVKSLIGGHNTSTNLGEITKITEKDESSQFCIGDNTVSFGDCNNTLLNYIKTEEKDDTDHELALNALKERFDVFVGTIATVFDEAAFREKRSFFIKLLTMVHAHKVKLSKFLGSQEQNKKAFYFDLWHQTLGQQSQHDYTQTSMICEKEAGIDQMLEEAQLSRAIAFHSSKLLKKYFYQGFLGHYVVCKLGPESLQQQEQELLPEPIKNQDQRSKSPSMRPTSTTPQDKRKSLPVNQRSKTPTNSQSLNIANFNLKPTSTRKYTPTDRSFRSQTCLTSPNQSFIKGTKYPPKGAKGTKEIMSASVLDQSFGCETAKTMITEELIPDQIMTKIPQPQKKEGLETLRFDTPRRMNTRNHTLESTERSIKSSTTGSNIKSRVPTQNRFGNSPSCQQSRKKKPQEIEKKIPEKKEFTKVLKKKYEPSRRETETTPPPLRQKTRSNSNLKKTEEKSVSSFTKTKGTRASYEEDDFFEVSEYNLQKALTFRKKKLTQFYGQKFLTILVTTTNRKIQAAWFLRIRNLLRKGLLGFLQAVECQDTQKSIEEIDEEEEHSQDNSEEEEEESENMKMMMNIAKEHHETTVKINVFNNLLEYFVQSHEEAKMYVQYRDNSLKRSCFSKWFEVLPKLKEEDEKFESAYEAIIQKFRFIMLTEKALRQWRNHIAEGGKNQPDE